MIFIASVCVVSLGILLIARAVCERRLAKLKEAGLYPEIEEDASIDDVIKLVRKNETTLAARLYRKIYKSGLVEAKSVF
jgi:hypothetical protein